MPARKLPKDYDLLAESKGIKWLGPEVPNRTIKTGWQCDMGHQWKATYASIYGSSKGCPVCGYISIRRKRQLKPEAYYALARRRGFKWLGPEVPNARTKTKWKCTEGHVWEAVYDKIKRGRGCPYCVGTTKTAQDYYSLAKERGFLWLGVKVPKKTNIKTGWECSGGHRWEANYNKIQQGRGCPYCAGTIPKTEKDYQILAIQAGLKWLGPMISNTEIRTRWKCSEGHEWNTAYRNIARGSGCPICFRENMKGEGHPAWRGGISFEPYGIDFDSDLKEYIRTRDNYLCQICGATEDKYNYNHAVHHIDYDKHNNNEDNLITLCIGCHCKTNWHRRFYQTILSPIAQKAEKVNKNK